MDHLLGQQADMKSVSLADAKVHLRALVDLAEAGGAEL
jgi:hypothetical protein